GVRMEVSRSGWRRLGESGAAAAPPPRRQPCFAFPSQLLPLGLKFVEPLTDPLDGLVGTSQPTRPSSSLAASFSHSKSQRNVITLGDIATSADGGSTAASGLPAGPQRSYRPPFPGPPSRCGARRDRSGRCPPPPPRPPAGRR